MPFMKKSCAHMKRSRLTNYYNKKAFKRIGFFMLMNVTTVSHLRKTKKEYYTNLNQKDIADNKQF